MPYARRSYLYKKRSVVNTRRPRVSRSTAKLNNTLLASLATRTAAHTIKFNITTNSTVWTAAMSTTAVRGEA